MVPTGDISMPCPCPAMRGEVHSMPRTCTMQFPWCCQLCQMSSMIQGWSLARSLKEAMEILCAMLNFACSALRFSLRRRLKYGDRQGRPGWG
ncbi:hypothetical protein DPMN_009759 [Dreissena polymorpha]|uniref:Uncharacterized protein n=1 Tax=Dreissena polymorpha TaxID=45954 RepID=A0A9D4N109_DREPO|nr:hypothetical protein DPMN_009759 [Dreissena polymorpha]